MSPKKGWPRPDKPPEDIENLHPTTEATVESATTEARVKPTIEETMFNSLKNYGSRVGRKR